MLTSDQLSALVLGRTRVVDTHKTIWVVIARSKQRYLTFPPYLDVRCERPGPLMRGLDVGDITSLPVAVLTVEGEP